jgi:hypothetical protein
VDILEFLFGNIFFILLIIWILSGVFGGKKKNQQQSPRRPRPMQTDQRQRMPDLSGRTEDAQPQTLEVDRPWETVEPKRTNPFDLDFDDEVVQPTIERPRLEPIRAEALKQHDHVREKRANVPDITVEDEISDMIQATRGQVEEVKYSSEAKELLDFKRIDQTSVVQGMVWSQVFGKPRVKDPHRTNLRARLGRRIQ